MVLHGRLGPAPPHIHPPPTHSWPGLCNQRVQSHCPHSPGELRAGVRGGAWSIWSRGRARLASAHRVPWPSPWAARCLPPTLCPLALTGQVLEWALRMVEPQHRKGEAGGTEAPGRSPRPAHTHLELSSPTRGPSRPQPPAPSPSGVCVTPTVPSSAPLSHHRVKWVLVQASCCDASEPLSDWPVVRVTLSKQRGRWGLQR